MEQGLQGASAPKSKAPLAQIAPAKATPTVKSTISGNPIIILPSAPNALITIFNCRDFFQNSVFVNPQEAKLKANGVKPAFVEFTHMMKNGSLVVFKVTS